uniref:Uncharacterized protein n=1 Tax=viral metagenome TaxID=1070528 RepID=A0A6C0GZP7_9ZZZZ
MTIITLKFIIDFFTDKSIITTNTKSNILELFQYSDEKCEKKFYDFIDLIMFIIDDLYDINAMSNKKNYLHTIIDDIINYIQDSHLLINKPKIISQIKNNELTQDIILIIAYIFDLNILIHENNILKAYYFSEKFNKYRNTILLKVESDPTDGTEYYKLLINNEKFIFNQKCKNLEELLKTEYIIPIGFIPNKSFEYTNNDESLINDRQISEVFVNKQVLEVKDIDIETKNKKINMINQNINKIENSDSDNEIINEKLLMDYTNLNFNIDLESDDD